MRVKAAQVFEMPSKMTMDEGAAIPVNYLTAALMMFEVGNIKEGGHLLVHMASGGVGMPVSVVA